MKTYVIEIRPDESSEWKTMRFLDTGKVMRFRSAREARRELPILMHRYRDWQRRIVEEIIASPL